MYDYAVYVAFPKGKKLCLCHFTVMVVAGMRKGVY